MGNPDQISYGRAARLRVAMSRLAAGLSDSAGDLVPTYADGQVLGGEFVEYAASIAAGARQLLEHAVAYERRRGTSWEVIGNALGGTSRQGAHERFAAAASDLDDEIVRGWLLDDDPHRNAGQPYGTAVLAAEAAALDRWVTSTLDASHPLASKSEDDPERQYPVSYGLVPMDAAENTALVMAGASMIARLKMADEFDVPEVRALELGLARRQIEFYERMVAEDVDQPSFRPPGTSYADLLAASRAHLAVLEFGAAQEKKHQ